MTDDNWAPCSPRPNHKVSRNLDPQMHGMPGPSVCGYALIPANLDPNYGLDSATALWLTMESQRLWEQTQIENMDRWNLSAIELQSSKGRKTLKENTNLEVLG